MCLLSAKSAVHQRAILLFPLTAPATATRCFSTAFFFSLVICGVRQLSRRAADMHTIEAECSHQLRVADPSLPQPSLGAAAAPCRWATVEEYAYDVAGRVPDGCQRGVALRSVGEFGGVGEQRRPADFGCLLIYRPRRVSADKCAAAHGTQVAAPGSQGAPARRPQRREPSWTFAIAGRVTHTEGASALCARKPRW